MPDTSRNKRQSTRQREEPAPKRKPESEDLSKASKQHADNLGEIAKLEEKIAKIAAMNFESAKGRALQLKKIAQLSEELNTFLEDTKRLEEDIEAILDEEEKTERGIVQLGRQRRQNLKETQDLSKEIQRSIRASAIATKDLSDIGKVVTDNMKASVGFSTAFGDVTNRANNLLKSGVNLSDEFMDSLQESNRVRVEYGDIEREIAQNAQKAATGEYDAESIQLDLAKKMQKFDLDNQEFQKKTEEFFKNRDKMTKEQRDAMVYELQMEKQILKAREASLEAMGKQNEALGEASKQAGKTIGVFDKVTSGDFKGALLQSFGLDEVNKKVKEQLGGALVNVVKEIKGGGGLTGAFKAVGQGLGGLIKMAPMLLKALGIGIIIGLVSFLIGSFGKLDEEVSQLGKEMGIPKSEAKELHHAAVDAANEMRIVGINAEKVAKGLKTASDTLGGLDLTEKFAAGDDKVKQLVEDATVLTEEFGLSGDQVGNIHDLAVMSGKSMGQLTAEANTLNKGLMTGKESMKVLASIPKGVAVAFKGGTQELIKAASKAKLLGMELSKVQSIGMGMLEIEDSLEKEMEARVLTGKDLNLDAARQYALQGDIASLQDELLKQAGSLKEFQSMGPIQQKAMADAMGMSVEEMTTMLTNAEKLKELGISQEKMDKLQAMNAADLNKELAKGGSQQYQDYIKKLAKEKESAATQEKLADLMERIRAVAVKILDPIMDMVDGLFKGEDGGKAVDGILNTIKATVSVIKPIVEGIAYVIGLIVKPLTWIMGLFASTEEKTEGIAKGAKSVGDAIKPVEASFGNISKFALGIGGLFIGKKLFGGASKMMGGMMGKLLPFGKKKEEAAGGEGGADSGAAKEATKGKNIVSTILDKVKAIIDSLKGVVQSGIKFVKDVGKDLIKMLAELIKEVGNLLNQILDLVKNVGSNLISTISKLVSEFGNLLTTLLDVIGNVGTKLISVVGDLLNGIVDLLNSVGSNLLSTLDKLLQGIGKILNSAVEIVVNVGTKLAEGAVKILNIIMRGLASAAATLPGIMASLGAAVVAFFTPMAALVNPLVIAGIAIFVAALIGMGYAFKLLGEGIGAAAPGITAFFDGVGGVIQKVGEAIAKVIETITTSIIRLQDIDGKKMLGAALGIYAIAGALAAFGGGSLFAGLGSALGKLFDEDPVDKFNRFASIDGKGLLAVATAINTLGQAIQNFSNVSGGLKLDKVDAMIEKIQDLKAAQTSAAISDLATTGVNAVTKFVGNLFGGSEEQKSQPVGSSSGGKATGGETTNPMINVEKKLDTLINLFSQVANQPTVIKFGEKIVDEIKGQIDFKKAYNVKVDNTYGRSV